MGAGPGPEAAVICQALRILSSDNILWTTREDYRVLKLHSSTDRLPERHLTLMVTGFTCLLQMVVLSSAPFPIHPLLMQMIVDGRGGLNLDQDFLRCVDPCILGVLTPWIECDPHGRFISGGQTPLGALLAASDIDVSDKPEYIYLLKS